MDVLATPQKLNESRKSTSARHGLYGRNPYNHVDIPHRLHFKPRCFPAPSISEPNCDVSRSGGPVRRRSERRRSNLQASGSHSEVRSDSGQLEPTEQPPSQPQQQQSAREAQVPRRSPPQGDPPPRRPVKAEPKDSGPGNGETTNDNATVYSATLFRQLREKGRQAIRDSLKVLEEERRDTEALVKDSIRHLELLDDPSDPGREYFVIIRAKGSKHVGAIEKKIERLRNIETMQ